MAVLGVLLAVLRHPATIIVGVVLGFVVGFRQPDFAAGLESAARIYIDLLSMCLLPILVTALIWGVGQILRNRETQPLFGRMAWLYGAGLLIPCVSGIGVALIFEPGASLGPEAQELLGRRLQRASEPTSSVGVTGFLEELVPSNVFHALSSGQFVSIVFFCALVGVALGVIRSPGADQSLRVLNAFYEAFSKLFAWVLVPLGFGLFCIVAHNVSQAEPELLRALLSYVGFYWVAGLVVLVIQTLVISLVVREVPGRSVLALKTPLVVAFATDNPFVALYSAIDALRDSYGVPKAVADTVTPFGVVANQHGQVLLFSFTSVFIAQVYGIELGPGALLALGMGCLIAGAAAVGGGAALAPMLAPVLLGAGVPTALTVVVLATTQPVIANLSSLLTVHATCNLAVLTSRGKRSERPKPAPEDPS